MHSRNESRACLSSKHTKEWKPRGKSRVTANCRALLWNSIPLRSISFLLRRPGRWILWSMLHLKGGITTYSCFYSTWSALSGVWMTYALKVNLNSISSIQFFVMITIEVSVGIIIDQSLNANYNTVTYVYGYLPWSKVQDPFILKNQSIKHKYMNVSTYSHVNPK